jgi:protease-4
MTLDHDTLLDRRHLKRRLSFWRLAVLVLIIGGVMFAARDLQNFRQQDAIARYTIFEVIMDDPWRDQLMAEIAQDDDIKALIVRINSPGGSTAGSEALYESLRLVANEKPVVAVMGTVAASGGYMASLAADRIFARNNTITGSIGVIFQSPNVKKLLGDLGVRFETIKSSTLKASPGPFEDPDPKAIAVMRSMILDTQDWFVSLVAERRQMDRVTADKLSDGRVYTGRQALAVNLIDEIGGEREAMKWLETEKKIGKDLDVLDVGLFEEEDLLTKIITNSAVKIFDTLGDKISTKALGTNGLISKWKQ